MEKRKLVLRNFQSPGDIVMLTAAVRDLHACCPGQFDLADVSLTNEGMFLWGFLKGFGMGAWDCSGGAVTALGGAFWNKAKEFLAHPVKVTSDVYGKHKLALRKAGQYAKMMTLIVRKLAHGDDQFFHQIANGQYKDFNDLTEEIRHVFVFIVDMLKSMWDEIKTFYERALNSTDTVAQGEAFGKLMFEIFSTLAPFAKAGKLAQMGGKLAVLQSKIPLANVIRQRFPLFVELEAKTAAKVTEVSKYAVTVATDSKTISRMATETTSSYLKHKATNFAKEAFKLALKDNKEAAGPDLDGLIKGGFDDMCAEAAAGADPDTGTPPDFNKHPTHKENHEMMRKDTGTGNGGSTERAGKEKPEVNGTKRTTGSRTHQESHHGAPQYVQNHLCPKAGATFPPGCTPLAGSKGRINPNCTPARLLPKRHHVGKDPKSIHGKMNLAKMAWQTLRASKNPDFPDRIPIKMAEIILKMRKAYGAPPDGVGLDCFGEMSIKWLEKYFQDC